MAIIKKFRITTFKKEIHKVSLKKISISYNQRQILVDKHQIQEEFVWQMLIMMAISM